MAGTNTVTIDAANAALIVKGNLKIKVSCLDTNGVEYYSRVADFSSLEKGAVWPHVQTVSSSVAESDLRSDFDVRIEILTPSERKQDKAYLHTPLHFPDGYPNKK